MRTNWFLLTLMIWGSSLSAQEDSFSMNAPSPSVIARISLVSPKIIAEFAPSDVFTLTTGFWVRATFYSENPQGDLVYQPRFSPSITLEPKYYFNLEQRAAKGKRTD